MTKQSNKNSDLSKILLPYENMWVALSQNNRKVMGAARTLTELLKEFKDKDIRKYELMKVPDFNFCYAPFI